MQKEDMVFYRKIDPLSRVTLPKDLMLAAGISKEQEVELRYTDGAICISPAVKTCAICGGKEDLLPMEGTSRALCRKCAALAYEKLMEGRK